MLKTLLPLTRPFKESCRKVKNFSSLFYAGVVNYQESGRRRAVGYMNSFQLYLDVTVEENKNNVRRGSDAGAGPNFSEERYCVIRNTHGHIAFENI